MVGPALGGIGPLAVGALLVPLRDEVHNANLALVLMFVVTVAAIVGGRGAGALAAVTSTFAFDFFLTRPFLSVRIDTSSDIETALVLLAVGLLVGEVASRGRRSRMVFDRGREAARLVLLADPEAPATLESRIVAVALADQLGAAVALASDDDLRRVAFDRAQPNAE